MCGIAGILRLDGAALPEEARIAVKAMTDSMVHRGPDGEGQWLDGPICLGHRRLSILDLAGGAQPMSYSSGKYWIIFNGEIYNFMDLRKELEKYGCRFKTNCDTEIIPAAWQHWGSNCLEYLEGMFAFALWDTGRQILFCARDHFGKKPFYYTVQNGYLAFASELQGLEILHKKCRFASFDFNPSPHAIMRYLAYEYVPCPATIYKEVSVLEPAHFMLISRGSITRERYWDLPAPAKNIQASDSDLCAELRSLMQRATKMRMISDVPLGVFLSGGIDSSIVTGLMAELSPRPIETFSIGFREASYDESHYAQIVSRAFGTIHHERILSAADCADELPGLVQRMDTPMADASCAPSWLLAGLTRENVTVALGGDGADELWAGYEHYIGYNLALMFNRLPEFIRMKAIPALARLLPSSSGYINPRLVVKTFLAGARAPDWLRVETMLTAIDINLQKEILNPDWLNMAGKSFLAQEKLFEPTKIQYEHWQNMPGATPLARAFHVYCRQFLLDDILVKVDRCSMLHSLEVRAPFLDKHVSEFAARLPISYKLRGFKRKYLLKKAFSSLLPREILRRNKRGFQIPVADWLRGKLKPLLSDMANESRLKDQGIFSARGIARLLQEHFSGERDLRKPLWTFLVFQLWWEGHIRNMKNFPDTLDRN